MKRRDVLKSAIFGGLAIVANPLAAFGRPQTPYVPAVRYDLPSVKLLCDSIDMEAIGAAHMCVNSDWVFGKAPGNVLFCGFSAERQLSGWRLTLDFRGSDDGFDCVVCMRGQPRERVKVFESAVLQPLLKMGRRVA